MYRERHGGKYKFAIVFLQGWCQQHHRCNQPGYVIVYIVQEILGDDERAAVVAPGDGRIACFLATIRVNLGLALVIIGGGLSEC